MSPSLAPSAGSGRSSAISNCLAKHVANEAMQMCATPRLSSSKAASSGMAHSSVHFILVICSYISSCSNPSQELQKSYADIQEENHTLRARLAQLEVESIHADGAHVHSMHRGETQLYALLNRHCRRPVVASATDIKLPAPHVRQYIVAHGGQWISWIHPAFDFSTFHADCIKLEHDLHALPFELTAESSWLALWFAFLTVPHMVYSRNGFYPMLISTRLPCSS